MVTHSPSSLSLCHGYPFQTASSAYCHHYMHVCCYSLVPWPLLFLSFCLFSLSSFVAISWILLLLDASTYIDVSYISMFVRNFSTSYFLGSHCSMCDLIPFFWFVMLSLCSAMMGMLVWQWGTSLPMRSMYGGAAPIWTTSLNSECHHLCLYYSSKATIIYYWTYDILNHGWWESLLE